MPVQHIFVINRAGSLIHDFDASPRTGETERTYTYPLGFRLEMIDQRATVSFGERDGVQVGHAVLQVNGEPVKQGGRLLCRAKTTDEEGETQDVDVDVLEYLADEANYPVRIKFGRAPLTTNEKIILSSMFHSLYAIATQLSPAATSSGIHTVDADQFTLHCFQTLTGVKFVAVADPMTANLDMLLRRIYEFYADFALKNPFYSLDMPIRCELFDSNLHALIERFNKSGVLAV